MDLNQANERCSVLCDWESAPECGVMPLCRAEAGKRVKVACVNGGRGLCARMAAMGIYPGVVVQPLCSGCIRVNNGVLGLGDEISGKILVTPAA